MEPDEKALLCRAGSRGNTGDSSPCLHRRRAGTARRVPQCDRIDAQSAARVGQRARLSRRRAWSICSPTRVSCWPSPIAPPSIRPLLAGRATRSAAIGNATYREPRTCGGCELLPRLPCRCAPQAARCPACGSPRLIRHDELATLSIAHVDCDAFYATIEKRDDPVARRRAGDRRRRPARRRRRVPAISRAPTASDRRCRCTRRCGFVRMPKWCGPIWRNIPRPAAKCGR